MQTHIFLRFAAPSRVSPLPLTLQSYFPVLQFASAVETSRTRSNPDERHVSSTHDGDVEGYARFSSFSDPDGNPFQLIEYARPQPESIPGVHGAR